MLPSSIFALAMAIALGASACSTSHGPGDAKARSMVAKGATLLDVRSDAEFAAGHLEGAMHIPIAELEMRLEELPLDRAVVVYCASGVRSAAAARQLDAAGLDVYDVGGMSSY